jgi:hypothetical protein
MLSQCFQILGIPAIATDLKGFSSAFVHDEPQWQQTVNAVVQMPCPGILAPRVGPVDALGATQLQRLQFILKAVFIGGIKMSWT